ncbi:MAG TPA: DUF4010 domain-containing protein [Deltaproteobacteria bacterium]|nr:DUF4010 domain-containing protein [Deltaproteobacteria bacterium]
MEESGLFIRFGVALIIGVLVGMQREYAFDTPGKELATGVRTLAVMGLLGCAGAFLSDLMRSPWPLTAIIIIVGIFFAVNYFIDAWNGDTGLTTETSGILTLLAGALAYWDQLALAVAIGVATAVLLSIKPEMHRFVERLTREDIFATMKFAVITAIVLPVLPNRVFGPAPFDIFNPYKIWLLVVLISGISFVGYILIKIAGARKGIGLTGLLGGLASSTAVTLSFTSKSKTDEEFSKPFALAIIVAWTVMFSRVIVEVAVVNFPLARQIFLPIMVPIVAGLAYCIYLYLRHKTDQEADVAFHNPFELVPAVTFGIIFVIILFLSKAAHVYLGDTGIYLSSIVAGLADVDAIALSVADLSRGETGSSLQTAGRAVMFAAVSNTFFKGCLVLFMGAPSLRRAILPGFCLMLVTGAAAALML